MLSRQLTKAIRARIAGSQQTAWLKCDRHVSGLVTNAEAIHLLNEGYAFSATDIEEKNTGIQYWVFQTPDSDKRVHMVIDIAATSEVRFDMYAGTDREGVDEISIINVNQNSSNTSDSMFWANITGGTTDGTLIYSKRTGASRPAGTVAPGADRSFAAWIFEPNKKYLMKAETFNTSFVSIHLEFLETINEHK